MKPNITHPVEKKENLLSLIDDMTAAALDHTSHGYTLFLECRRNLLSLIDEYVEEDKKRINFAMSVVDQVNELFEFKDKSR